MAAKECLQLYLCNHHMFSKGATDFAFCNEAMQRSKPWEWVAHLCVHSRIRKGWHHFKALQRQSIEAVITVQDRPFPENAPEYQHYQFLLYRWALDLLPFLLEKSAVSLELADVLHGSTFTMMAQKFPQRRRLVKEVIARYLVWVATAKVALGNGKLFQIIR